MKKILTVLVFALLFAVHAYEVMLWGDMHYSRPRHLDPEKFAEKYLNYCRKLETQWDQYNPELMKSCVAKGGGCDFAIHLGDMVDGHYRSEAKYLEAMQTMTGELRSRWGGKPIEFIKGNHEGYDGPEARKWYKMALPDGLNRVKMHGGDLFIYYNAIEPDLAFAERALKSHPEARRVFFFTHYPLAPCTRNAAAMIKPSESRLQLLKLLAERRATIFCGHIHATTRVVFTEPSTGRKLVQISLFSLIYAPRAAKESVDRMSGAKYMAGPYVRKSLDRSKYSDSVAEFWKKAMVSFEMFYPGNGFAVLKCDGPKAVLTLYRWSQKETATVLELTPQE